jgi:isovaleryl-CoA dehydrogenase
MMRDALGMRIAGGTGDIQRINIFNNMSRLQVYHDDLAAPGV